MQGDAFIFDCLKLVLEGDNREWSMLTALRPRIYAIEVLVYAAGVAEVLATYWIGLHCLPVEYQRFAGIRWSCQRWT